MSTSPELSANQVGILISDLAEADQKRFADEEFMHISPRRPYDVYDAFEQSNVFEELVQEAEGIRDGTITTNHTSDNYDNHVNFAIFKWLAFGVYSALQNDPNSIILSPIASAQYYCKRNPNSEREKHMFEEERPKDPFSSQGIKIRREAEPEKSEVVDAVEYTMSGYKAVIKKLYYFGDRRCVDPVLSDVGIAIVRPMPRKIPRLINGVVYIPLDRIKIGNEIQRMRQARGI